MVSANQCVAVSSTDWAICCKLTPVYTVIQKNASAVTFSDNSKTYLTWYQQFLIYKDYARWSLNLHPIAFTVLISIQIRYGYVTAIRFYVTVYRNIAERATSHAPEDQFMASTCVVTSTSYTYTFCAYFSLWRSMLWSRCDAYTLTP